MLKEVVMNLIKRWGFVKVLEAVTEQLHKMGDKECELADEVDDAIANYKRNA